MLHGNRSKKMEGFFSSVVNTVVGVATGDGGSQQAADPNLNLVWLQSTRMKYYQEYVKIADTILNKIRERVTDPEVFKRFQDEHVRLNSILLDKLNNTKTYKGFEPTIKIYVKDQYIMNMNRINNNIINEQKWQLTAGLRPKYNEFVTEKFNVLLERAMTLTTDEILIEKLKDTHDQMLRRALHEIEQSVTTKEWEQIINYLYVQLIGILANTYNVYMKEQAEILKKMNENNEYFQKIDEIKLLEQEQEHNKYVDAEMLYEQQIKKRNEEIKKGESVDNEEMKTTESSLFERVKKYKWFVLIVLLLIIIITMGKKRANYDSIYNSKLQRFNQK